MTLEQLRIVRFPRLSGATVDFGEGLCAMTGETGSGKSLSVAALRWALGDKLGGAPVGDDPDVTAVFGEVGSLVEDILSHNEVSCDEGMVAVTRRLGNGGRSTFRVNGCLVPRSVVAAVVPHLIEITAQGESTTLRSASRPRELLDSFIGETAKQARRGLREAAATLRDAITARAGSERSATERVRQMEEARRLVTEVGAGEVSEVRREAARSEHVLLLSATRLASAAKELWRGATGADEEQADAYTLIGHGVTSLDALGLQEATIVGLSERAHEVLAAVRDLGDMARELMERCEDNPGRVEELSQELSTLASLERRYGSLDLAAAAVAEARSLVEGHVVEGAANYARLEEAARAAVIERSVALRTIRQRGAGGLERAVEKVLHQLGMDKARLSIAFRESETSAEGGDDEVGFLIAADGAEMHPLEMVASGGELSRLALALRAVVAEEGAAALLLDEIDVGVGGDTAARMGQLLTRIGQNRQVITVTHRAEIAAHATTHVRVVAQGSGALIDRVEGGERVEEMARLLSGTPTDAARARATELLEAARR